MEIEKLNNDFSIILNQVLPFKTKLSSFLNSYEGKMTIIRSVSNGNTQFIINLRYFYSKHDFNNIINKLYKFYLRYFKNTIFFSSVRFEKALLNLNLDLLGCNMVDEENFRNIISFHFSKYKKINLSQIDKIASIFQDDIIFSKYNYLIESHFHKNMRFVKQSVLEIDNVNLNIKSLIQMLICFGIFLIKLNKHNDRFQNHIYDILNFTYYDLIEEKRVRESELEIVKWKLDKLNKENSNNWAYLSELNYKKILLQSRLSYIESFRFLMSNNDIIKFIQNTEFQNENYYEYLLYVDYNKQFLILNDSVISNLKQILLLNRRENFELLLSIFSYYFLTNKKCFNINQEMILKDYKANPDLWLNGLVRTFYLYYFLFNNDEDDMWGSDFDIYNSLMCTSILLQFLLINEYRSIDIFYDMAFIMLKFYNDNHSKIQSDFIISFLYKLDTKFIIERGNLMYFFDMVYNSNENFNMLIENVVNDNYIYILKYLKAGYLDLDKIKNNRPIYDLFYNMNSIMIDITYTVEDLITGFPIVEFICMPHDKNLFIDKVTIYKWLRKKEINPFTNEYMDFNSLNKFNSIVHIENICNEKNRKVFSLSLKK